MDNKIEFKKYKDIYEAERDVRDSQVNALMQEITNLRFEIEKQGNRDIIKEIYEQNKISNKNISLQEFRQGIYSN